MRCARCFSQCWIWRQTTAFFPFTIDEFESVHNCKYLRVPKDCIHPSAELLYTNLYSLKISGRFAQLYTLTFIIPLLLWPHYWSHQPGLLGLIPFSNSDTIFTAHFGANVNFGPHRDVNLTICSILAVLDRVHKSHPWSIYFLSLVVLSFLSFFISFFLSSCLSLFLPSLVPFFLSLFLSL